MKLLRAKMMKALRSEDVKVMQAAWDVIAAMRGPDRGEGMGSTALVLTDFKRKYTACLRGWATREIVGPVGQSVDNGYVQTPRPWMGELKERLKELREMESCPGGVHFLVHLRAGFAGAIFIEEMFPAAPKKD